MGTRAPSEGRDDVDDGFTVAALVARLTMRRAGTGGGAAGAGFTGV